MASSNPRPRRHDEQIHPRYTVQCGDSFVTLRRAGALTAALAVCPWLNPRTASWKERDRRHTDITGPWQGEPFTVHVTQIDP